MLAWILTCAGRNPGFLIGGIAPDLGVSARSTPDTAFVIEADEYDTAFFDKRSKFVHYRPKTAILNNLEFDHADIFDDLAAIERQFHHFVRTIPGAGRLVVNGRDEALKRVLAHGCWTPVEVFGAVGGWEASAPDEEGGFEVAWQGDAVGRVRWSMAGTYNRMNALAAIGAARHAGVDPAQALDALGRFGGVRRRLELRGRVRGVQVYDDFAHHPTAIRETIDALRQRIDGLRKRIDGSRDHDSPARILAVFEPRSNTLKRGILNEALPGAFAGADQVYIHTAGLNWDAAAVFAPLEARVRCRAELPAVVADIAAEARDGDHILVMSNGGFGGIHEKLLAALQRP
jgi:UDP-N-acetylmuramate: L-alanyl-gamma-D-glutamyl-meso-diaminopimelate ligase